ncbi:MAG TPA: endopeptidase La [Bacteroidales bacterium]|nr:endopeptidase La [Bacteroidales bacterium]HSA42700.1 endopeptidase La [Bacteroidales bacterium]
MKPDLLQLSDLYEGETEFIPLLSQEEEDQMNAEDVPEVLPILPLRNTVLFPGVVIPITVGRDKSIRLIKESYKGNKTIGVVAQKEAEVEDPEFKDIHSVGTVASIMRLLQMPDGSTTAIIQGKKRFQIVEPLQVDPYFKASVRQFDTVRTKTKSREFKALIASIKDLAIQIIRMSPQIPSDAAFAIRNIESPAFLVNFVASNLNVDLAEKQKLLEVPDLNERAQLVLSALTHDLQMLELKNQIQDKVKTDIDKQQRDYFLSQQLKTIQEELGMNPNEQHMNELRDKSRNRKWSKEVEETFTREFLKLQRMNPMAAEYSIQANYLDVMVELPWNEFTNDNFDLKNAQRVLDADHYGLEKVKQRIIEYLAVLKLKDDIKSPILCLVGPPGVGKTSLGRSIARAVGRKYVRMSLGGLRDEAEIRGHRRTYIGAMPGRIIQSIRKAKSSNPVFVLDEIDKVLGMNINGDPSAALLEVLDPEQNSAFYDNFLEINYDLSRVMFIATANTLSTIHPALTDRMEVIEINGYLLEEKIQIAKKHLIPKQLKEHGIRASQVVFTDDILEKIIELYTRESGVRLLEKTVARILRSNARYIVEGEKYNKKISMADLERILGPAPYQKEKDTRIRIPGVVTGLAWTPVGGEILFVEVSLSKGKGDLTLTGNLGEVMKESATLAFEYLKSHAPALGLGNTVFEDYHVHIHVPEGATPKDGPSAGITIFTALVSAFTGRKIRPGLAMTGEITLRGKVLPVGGIKEKILAAKRAKLTQIILSLENRKDLKEVKEDYLHGLEFHLVENMMEVIGLALEENVSRAE